MTQDIATILDRYGKDRTELMDILWDIQHSCGYIPAEAVSVVAVRLGLTPDDVMETASFYHFFHSEPSGRYRIYLSNTVIGKMHGHQQVFEALERETGTQFGGPGSATPPIREWSKTRTPSVSLTTK
jgi:[NiFe] hydrogenase diaphorase moiety large subunit